MMSFFFLLNKRSALLVLLLASPVTCFAAAGAAAPPPTLSRWISKREAVATAEDNDKTPPPDFSGQAAGLFGNIRIPAALFAGAAAAQAYAMPVTMANDGLMLGFAKRLYALLMIGSLASQTNTILISTVTMASLSSGKSKQGDTSSPPPATSLVEWVGQHYDAEWTTVKFNFITGIVSFTLAAALRAKLTMVCPVLAAACVGVLISSTLLSLAFVDDMEGSVHNGQGLFHLPLKMLQVTWRLSTKSPLFALAALSYAVTFLFVAIKIPHLYVYLASAGK